MRILNAACSNSLLIYRTPKLILFLLASTYRFIDVKVKRKLLSQDILTMYRRLWSRLRNVSLLNGLESERPLRRITRSMTLFYLGNHIRSACRVLKSPRAIPRWRVDLDLCAVTAVTVSRWREIRFPFCYSVATRDRDICWDFFRGKVPLVLRDEILKALYKMLDSIAFQTLAIAH